MASKMAKYGHLEYLVEYPTLMLDGQNLNYCIRFEENVQKPYKTECFRIQPTYPSNTSW